MLILFLYFYQNKLYKKSSFFLLIYVFLGILQYNLPNLDFGQVASATNFIQKSKVLKKVDIISPKSMTAFMHTCISPFNPMIILRKTKSIAIGQNAFPRAPYQIRFEDGCTIASAEGDNIFQHMVLDIDSLISIINALDDLTGQDSKTLTLGSNNLWKLSSDQIAIAINKNWMVV